MGFLTSIGNQISGAMVDVPSFSEFGIEGTSDLVRLESKGVKGEMAEVLRDRQNISRGDVVQLSRKAGELKGRAKLEQEATKHMGTCAQALNSIYAAKAQQRAIAMRAINGLQRTDSKYREQLALFSLNGQTQQAQISGYEQALNGAGGMWR